MQWRGRRESGNVVDRRGLGGAGMLGGGGLIIVALIYALMGGDPRVVLDSAQQSAPSQTQSTANRNDDQKKFVSVVLADTEDVWGRIFANSGARYTEPKLVLFDRRVDSACGRASSAVGPFYCSADRQVYLDLAFFSDLERKLGASGDFARAYVVAHEVGHHVQNLMGTTRQVQAQSQRLDDAGRNALSVKVELQADCYAGVWAKQTENAKHVLEQGDIEEAVTAAAAVGDDRLQKQGQGYVVPDSFTHGSSEQRVSWFSRGFQRGEPGDCDTFAVAH